MAAKRSYHQSAAVPYRNRDGAVEILLISSKKKKHWVVPKGANGRGGSAQETAAGKALEEAGVEGVVLPEPIGEYEYRKWGGNCRVVVYLMKVETVHKYWSESHRARQWWSAEAAALEVKESGLGRLLALIPERVLKEKKVGLS